MRGPGIQDGNCPASSPPWLFPVDGVISWSVSKHIDFGLKVELVPHFFGSVLVSLCVCNHVCPNDR
jgi:hypothetical protein